MHFGTDQRISPIAEGKGYWKYIPHQEGVTFLTQYDYDIRYGKLGRLFDCLFKPQMGWATALSFDVLKRWIERGELPASQYRRLVISVLTIMLFFFVWFYHGLVPKVLFMHEEELKLFSNVSWMPQDAVQTMVYLVGVAEIAFAFLWLLPIWKRPLFLLQIVVFPILTLRAVYSNIHVATAAFNPVTFNAALWVLSIFGFLESKDLPTAKKCKRKRGHSA
ncbi:DoxX-like family protein [Solibacillus sp. FSL H8-0538]|uniref:DoxX-like family protein n=1 Tax=Solibacillus sp. FSL H8-0538 TaxID=2921400 RepID=UPI0030FC74D4